MYTPATMIPKNKISTVERTKLTQTQTLQTIPTRLLGNSQATSLTTNRNNIQGTRFKYCIQITYYNGIALARKHPGASVVARYLFNLARTYVQFHMTPENEKRL